MTESIVAMAERASGGKVSREDVSAKLVAATAHRWGAAFPDGGATELAAASGGGCLWDAERRVVGCGDFCVKPKVEGAALAARRRRRGRSRRWDPPPPRRCDETSTPSHPRLRDR